MRPPLLSTTQKVAPHATMCVARRGRKKETAPISATFSPLKDTRFTKPCTQARGIFKQHSTASFYDIAANAAAQAKAPQAAAALAIHLAIWRVQSAFHSAAGWMKKTGKKRIMHGMTTRHATHKDKTIGARTRWARKISNEHQPQRRTTLRNRNRNRPWTSSCSFSSSFFFLCDMGRWNRERAVAFCTHIRTRDCVLVCRARWQDIVARHSAIVVWSVLGTGNVMCV